MSEENATPEPTETAPESTPENSPEPETPPTVPRDVYEKIIKEKRNTAAENAQMRAELKKLQEEKLMAQQNYQEVAKLKEEEANDWRSKYEQQNRMIEASVKDGAIKTELQKLGIKAERIDKAMKLVDPSLVQYDPETRTVSGAIEAAKSLSSELPELFQTNTIGTTNQAPSSAPASAMTIDEWSKLPPEEQKKHEEALWAHYGITRTR